MKRAKKILSVMLAMCLTTIMICGNTADAKTTYVKSFTKTITVKAGYQYYIKMNFKKASNVSVKIPGGTQRNFASYGHLMGEMPEEWRNLLCDPQTSGGLLLAVTPESEAEVQATAAEFGITLTAIGELVTARGGRPMIEIR